MKHPCITRVPTGIVNMTRVEPTNTSSHLAILKYLLLSVRVQTLDFPEYRVCGAYAHKAHIIFHRIDSRRNLYIDMKILKKITVEYIEYIQINLYRSADTIYCDIQYIMTIIIMFLLEHHKWS